MEGPIDYSGAFAPQSPTQALAGGYALGQGIRDDFQQQAAIQQAQQQQVQQQQVLQGLVANPKAGAQEYSAASLLFPKLRESIDQAWKMKNTAQQESALKDYGQAFSAINSGRPDIAVQQLQAKADAGERSGQMSPQDVQALRTHAQVIAAHPEFARMQAGMMLAAIPGGDKVLSGATSIGTEQRAQQQAPADLLKKQADASKAQAEVPFVAPKAQADINNIQSQIGERTAQVKNLSDRLSLDQDRLTSEVQMKVQEFRQKAGELPEPVMKNINEATTNAIAAKQSAEKMTGLADQLESLGGTGWGAAGSANEFIRKNLGMQNGLSQLRGEYNRIVTPAAMAAYKQVASGSTSDKDIETAMIGVPKDTADTSLMASFLRGTAKLQRYNEVLENAKSEWYAGNKFLGKSTSDMEIDGVKVPKGSSFKDFTEQYVTKKAGQMQGQSVLDSLAKKYSSGATGSY